MNTATRFEHALNKVERYKLTGGNEPGQRRAVSVCPCCIDDGGPYAVQPLGDDGPSLTIIEDEEGGVHVTCLNGCDPSEIYAELGINKPNLIAPPKLRAHEALDLIWLESFVLNIAANKMVNHETITDEDCERIGLCQERLRRVMRFYRG